MNILFLIFWIKNMRIDNWYNSSIDEISIRRKQMMFSSNKKKIFSHNLSSLLSSKCLRNFFVFTWNQTNQICVCFLSQCYNFVRLIRNVSTTIFVDSSRVSRVLGSRPLSRGSLHCLPQWRKYTHQLAIEDCILFRAWLMSNCYSTTSVLMW